MSRPFLEKPTKRFSITLEIEYIELLEEFAEINGKLRAGVVRTMLEQMRPTIEAMVEISKTAKHDEEKALQLAHQTIGAAFFQSTQSALFDD